MTREELIKKIRERISERYKNHLAFCAAAGISMSTLTGLLNRGRRCHSAVVGRMERALEMDLSLLCVADESQKIENFFARLWGDRALAKRMAKEIPRVRCQIE